VALYRVISAEKYDYWPYVTQRVAGLTQQFAPVNVGKCLAGRNIQFIPYGLLASVIPDQPNPPTRRRRLPSSSVRTPRGLDAKFVAKIPDLRRHAESDFSQVNRPTAVTVQPAFRPSFSRKNAFFIENAGFFHDAIPISFSRGNCDRIRIPYDRKLGNWTLGALVIDDRSREWLQQAVPTHARGRRRACASRANSQAAYIGAFF